VAERDGGQQREGGRHGVRAPATALTLAGALPLLAAAALSGDGASRGVPAAAIAWLVLAAGAAGGRPLVDRFRWAVPAALRAAEYAALIWLASIAGADAVPAAFALLAAVTFRHYDVVYRLRHRGVLPPRWLNRAAGGWDGRVVAGLLLAVAGALPEALYALAALLGAAFVAESVHAWATFGRDQRPPVYEDEEEDAE
jgi:hypothetical protein